MKFSRCLNITVPNDFNSSITESFENFISRQDFYLSDRTKTFEFTKSYNNPLMPIELKTLLEISK